MLPLGASKHSPCNIWLLNSCHSVLLQIAQDKFSKRWRVLASKYHFGQTSRMQSLMDCKRLCWVDRWRSSCKSRHSSLVLGYHFNRNRSNCECEKDSRTCVCNSQAACSPTASIRGWDILQAFSFDSFQASIQRHVLRCALISVAK